MCTCVLSTVYCVPRTLVRGDQCARGTHAYMHALHPQYIILAEARLLNKMAPIMLAFGRDLLDWWPCSPIRKSGHSYTRGACSM